VRVRCGAYESETVFPVTAGRTYLEDSSCRGNSRDWPFSVRDRAEVRGLNVGPHDSATRVSTPVSLVSRDAVTHYGNRPRAAMSYV
jgi:hypothetical protein